MKKSIYIFSVLALGMSSCQEMTEEESFDCTLAYVEVPAFVPDCVSSRTDITIDPVAGALFTWNASDSLGVFPVSGYQAAFALSSQQSAGCSSAVFDGGTWKLRQETSYAAYYPFSDQAYDLTAETLHADYPTAQQRGNNNTSHLPAHDYLACPYVTVTEQMQTHFSLGHLASLVRFVITAPTDDNWRYLRLKGVADEFVSSATYSLKENPVRLHPVKTVDTVCINMSGITTDAEHRQIVLYAMVASNTAAEPKEWCFMLRGDAGVYYDTLRNSTESPNIVRILKPGMAYSRSVPFEGVSLGEDWAIPIAGDDEYYNPDAPILAPQQIGVRAVSYAFQNEVSSRMTMSEDNQISFVWSKTDVLGIFPKEGNQTAFPLSSQAGKTWALFDGNDWALRDNWQYAAYFPFSQANFHISPTRLPVSFESQLLDAAQPASNVGKYNYSYAPLTQVTEGRGIVFEMKGLGSLLKLTMTCPEPDTYSRLTIADPEVGIAHEATFNLMDSVPQLQTDANIFHESLGFDMVNYSTTKPGEQIVVYVMLMPQDHRMGSLIFTLHGNKGSYEAVARGRMLKAGEAVRMNIELESLY